MKKRFNIKLFITLLSIFFIFILVFPPVFETNDDSIIRKIIEGTYTGVPDGHVVQIKYPLMGILQMLYNVVQIIPWYSIFLVACTFVSAYTVLNILWDIKEIESNKKIIVSIVLILMIYIPTFIYTQYTIIAALMGVTGIYIILTKKNSIVNIIFLLLCYWIRSQVFYMLLPFVLLAILFVVINDNKDKRKVIYSHIKFMMCLGILLGASYVVNGIMYSGSEWEEYDKYFAGRTLLYDYTDIINGQNTSEWKKIHDDYKSLGVTENQIDVILSYDTMLDDKIDGEILQSYAEVIIEKNKENTAMIENVSSCVVEYVRRILITDAPISYFCLILYIILLALFVKYKNKKNILWMAMYTVARSFVWLYLIMRGRMPYRIVFPLYCVDIILMGGILLSFLRSNEESIGKMKINITHKIVTAMIIVLCTVQMGVVVIKHSVTLNKQKDYDRVVEYCAENEKNNYYYDVLSFEAYSGKLFDSFGNEANIMEMGGWMTANPLVNKKMANMGAKDLAELLYKSDNSYVIAHSMRDMKWLENYMNDRFKGCKMICVDEIVCDREYSFFVYSFE